MATIAQSNEQLIKVILDGSKHLKHVLDSKEIRKMSLIEKSYPLARLPVCGHCEKLAYWHHDGQSWCPKCGTYTKKPLTYGNYLAAGYDIDSSCATSRAMLEYERKRRRKLPIFRNEKGEIE